MILTGLGGLITPSDPRTTGGKIGDWLSRIAVRAIVLGMAVGFL